MAQYLRGDVLGALRRDLGIQLLQGAALETLELQFKVLERLLVLGKNLLFQVKRDLRLTCSNALKNLRLQRLEFSFWQLSLAGVLEGF